MSGSARKRRGWAAAVFGLALAARLGFVLLVDQPLLYTHQYTYLLNALRIAEHPDPVVYVLGSDEWRTWDQHWTIAPLYHLFVAAVFSVLGPHLRVLQVLQALLDSLAAVAVAALGREVAGRRGAWAGVAYALHWPAVEMSSWTLTENLHTPLLVAGVAVLVREARRPSPRLAFLGGLVLGLSALARSVTTGLVGLSALWRWWLGGRRRGLLFALLVGLGGATAVLPWTARNVLIIGEPVPIETAAYENIWFANHFTNPVQHRRQEAYVHSRPTPAEKRAAAWHFAQRGLRRHPDLFAEKVVRNFRHFFRPEGLQNLLAVERSFEPWRHAGSVLLDDLPLVLAVPPFLVFLLAGPRHRARGLIGLWVGYYLLMVVVVFHNEIRYRSAFVPFAFAGAAGGLALLGDPARRRRPLVLLASALGLLLSASMVAPYVPMAWRAARARLALSPARRAAERGDAATALARGAAAAALDPSSPRPWFDLGRALNHAGMAQAALDAYRRGVPFVLASSRASVALPGLLLATGREAEARQALGQVDRASWDEDPWLILECAWRELPPPRTDAVQLAVGDYGAVRGFLHPRGTDPGLSRHRLEWNRHDAPGGPRPPTGPHRWSRRTAWLRLVPTVAAAAYDVTVEMGSPFPSPLTSPTVTLSAVGGPSTRLVLGREVRPYALKVPAPGTGRPVLLRLDSPTWSLAGEPADQGVRVDRFRVAPAAP